MLEFRTKFWPAMKDGAAGIGTSISERYFNPIWERIDRRLHDLEEVRVSWVNATNDLIAFALQRIDGVLAPAFARVSRIATLGFLVAHSATTETLAEDEVSTFIIDDPDERELFHPSAFVTIAKPGVPEDFAVAQVVSYNRTNGVLDVTIRQVFGDPGPYDKWEVSTGSGVPLLMRQQLTDARAARDLAKDWAEKANNTDVSGTGTRSAKHHASAASGFAEEAKTARDQVNAAAIIVAGGPVSSVNGKTGTVTLTAADLGAAASDHAHDDRYYTETEVDAALGDKLSKAGGAMSGKLEMADNEIERPYLKDIAETVNALGDVSGTATVNLEAGNVVTATVTGATTWTFSNPPASGRSGTFVLRLTNGGSATQTWPSSVKKPGGTAPSLTASGRDRLIFTTDDGGTTWDMVLAGKDFK